MLNPWYSWLLLLRLYKASIILQLITITVAVIKVWKQLEIDQLICKPINLLVSI